MKTTVPSSVTTIVNAQALSGWVPRTGANIGGVAPAKFSFSLGVPWLPSALLLQVQGIVGKYCDWLAGLVIPLPASTGHVQMDLTFAVDSQTAMQAIEMDTKVTDAKQITHNGSMQWDYSQSATDMFLQIDKKGGGWINTGVSLPKFAVNVPHRVIQNLAFDEAAGTYSITDVTVDGVNYLMPESLQNLPGTKGGWAANEILPQLQQDVNTEGGAWQLLVYALNYSVW